MQPMRSAAISKALDGTTSAAEVRRVVFTESD